MRTLPRHIVRHVVKTYIGDAATLRNCRACCAWMKAWIRVHPKLMRACARCGSTKRWSVTSDPSKCATRGCMARRDIHYIVRYFTVHGEPLCSYGCCVGL